MAKGYEQIISKYANELVEQMKSNLLAAMRMRASEVGGRAPFASTLQQEILVEVQPDAVLITMPFYAMFIEHGVKGAKSTYPESKESKFKFRDKMPPTRVFSGAQGWISQRGIVDKGEFRSKGLSGRRLKSAVIKANKSLAFVIARSIRDKGIKGYHFIDKAMRSDVLDNLVEALANNTQEQIITRIIWQ
jgi:hypothetical protein